MNKKISLDEVRASLNKNVYAPFMFKRVWRPLSYIFTVPLYNFGATANQVTLFRTFVAVLAVVLLMFSAYPYFNILVFSLVCSCFVLDCVDGNLARLHDDASYWGKFADGLADFLYIQLAPLAAGLGLWLWYDRVDMLIAGSVITVATLASQMVRARLSFMREWMTSETGPLTSDDEEKRQELISAQGWMKSLYANGTTIAPCALLFGAPVGVEIYIYVLCVIQLLPELGWLYFSMREASAILRRYRKSRHAVE